MFFAICLLLIFIAFYFVIFAPLFLKKKQPYFTNKKKIALINTNVRLNEIEQDFEKGNLTKKIYQSYLKF